jgi:hypothetical protein
MGGVEAAFMSTTLDRSVAMGYAAGSKATGIVLELPQGMVNRGASVGWLSQYPHEEEILFGPLSGIEVQGTRVQGSVVIIEAGISINLGALTLEQVINKRHKIICSMCDNLQVELAKGLTDARLPYDADTKHKLEDFVEKVFKTITAAPGADFNDDGKFMKAIEKALNSKEWALQTWPQIKEMVSKDSCRAVREMNKVVSSALYHHCLYRDIVLEAVRQNSAALRYAGDALKQDRDFVLEAVKQNGTALFYAGDALKQDRDIVLEAVRQNGTALRYADDALKQDRDIMLEAEKQEGYALEHADFM